MTLSKLKLSIAAVALAASVGAQAKTTIEVTAWKGAGAEVANFPTIIDNFEKAYPDIKVDFKFISRGDTVTVIPSRLQAGDAPDVMMIDRDFLQVWGSEGQLMDLTDQPFVDRVQEGLQPLLALDGKVHYLMLELSGMGMYVNDDLMEKAGISTYPTSIDSMIDACDKLNNIGVTPMILPANNGGWSPHILVDSWGLANGSELPDQGKIDKINDGRINFAEDADFVAALEALAALRDAKCYNAKISAGTDPWSVGLATFQSGRVAMLPQGLWNITPFTKDGLPENFSLKPFPSARGDNGVMMDYIGPGWAIPVAAKNVDAAKKFIDFWSLDENLKLFVEADTAISPLKNGTDGLPALAKGYVDTRASGNYVAFPLGTWPPELTNLMANDIVSFMLDPKKDAVAVLKGWDEMRDKLNAK
jgi:raffinose/stachyose/melibiose transport system substrate-binding protein